jgi:DNA polymerase III subunit beta
MQVQIPKKNLSDALSALERIVPSRSSNAALTHLKVSTSERGLSLSGTNLEIDLEQFVEAQIVDPQDFVVPAHLFAQITKSLPGELVELHHTGSELTVASGGSTFKLQTGDLSAYPDLSFPSATDLTIDAREFAKSISSVRRRRGIQGDLPGRAARADTQPLPTCGDRWLQAGVPRL